MTWTIQKLLVERAIEFLRTRKNHQHILDLCTGSGCVAVAIAKNFHAADMIATDICDAALTIAARNLAQHELTDRVALLCGDLFEPIIAKLDDGKFDLIVCNPPYISSAEYERLDKNVKEYEPRAGLLAGEDGLDIYRRIIAQAERFLKPDAALMLEIGYAQARAVKELFENAHCFAEITIEKDLQHNDRIAIAKRIPG